MSEKYLVGFEKYLVPGGNVGSVGVLQEIHRLGQQRDGGRARGGRQLDPEQLRPHLIRVEEDVGLGGAAQIFGQ